MIPPRSIKPLVSFVMVTHGGGELLIGCLKALREHTREHHEVIVLDSASPDGTGEWARRALPWVKVHNSSENLGFGALSNAGVLDAQAPYICFLNADVTVEPNWLPPLLEVLETQPHVGAVAPLMLNPDRSVQEYGSVVGADGWTHAWTGAELGDQTEPFRRQVDYASGACLLVRRRAFIEVGGFAPEYHIAYFEDTDLAFKLREANWATVVEPRSVVVHERHGMSGSDRARQLMEYNHGTFASKWASQLQDRTSAPAQARDVTVAERILVIDDQVPDGDPRTQRLVEGLLSPDRLITFLAREDGHDARGLLDLGVEVVVGVTDVAEWMSRRLGCYDVVIVARPGNWEWAAHAVDVFQSQAVRVYDAATLFARKEKPADGYLQLEDDRIRELETNALKWADVGMCVTRQDADWVDNILAPNTYMHVVGYPAQPQMPIRAFDERSGVAFFGAFKSQPDSPDERSVLELASEVWPALHKQHDDLKLSIVGSGPTPAVRALADEQVEVVGRVPHLSWWMGRVRLHVAPVHDSTGPRLTFIESMAAGLPFLTTPLGAEGLHLGGLTEHLVAGSPAEMIELADRLLTDRPLWTDVQELLLDVVREHFSAAGFERSVDDVLLSCGVAPAGR